MDVAHCICRKVIHRHAVGLVRLDIFTTRAAGGCSSLPVGPVSAVGALQSAATTGVEARRGHCEVVVEGQREQDVQYVSSKVNIRYTSVVWMSATACRWWSLSPRYRSDLACSLLCRSRGMVFQQHTALYNTVLAKSQHAIIDNNVV